MEVDTIDHVNVETDDVDRSAKFYREVIGLKEGPRPDFDRPGFWMYAGDKPVVHIIKTAQNNKMLTGSRDASISHFALQIKNLKNARDHLDSLGIFQGAGGFLLKSKLDQRNLRRSHNQTN